MVAISAILSYNLTNTRNFHILYYSHEHITITVWHIIVLNISELQGNYTFIAPSPLHTPPTICVCSGLKKSTDAQDPKGAPQIADSLCVRCFFLIWLTLNLLGNLHHQSAISVKVGRFPIHISSYTVLFSSVQDVFYFMRLEKIKY